MIPGVSQSLPPVESPTREANVERESPMLRQITGLTLISPKNPAEKELDRLGFKRSEILPGLGDPKAARLAAKYMGPLVEKVVGQIVTGSGWQDRSDAEKAVILQGVLKRLRQNAFAQARGEAPELFGRLKYEGMPKRQRALLEEQMQ
jgi:hypothetical protein